MRYPPLDPLKMRPRSLSMASSSLNTRPPRSNRVLGPAERKPNTWSPSTKSCILKSNWGSSEMASTISAIVSSLSAFSVASAGSRRGSLSQNWGFDGRSRATSPSDSLRSPRESASAAGSVGRRVILRNNNARGFALRDSKQRRAICSFLGGRSGRDSG